MPFTFTEKIRSNSAALVGNIAAMRCCFSAFLLNFLNHRPHGVLSDVQHMHKRALPRESMSDRSPDAAPSARHNRGFVSKPQCVHFTFLFQGRFSSCLGAFVSP